MLRNFVWICILLFSLLVIASLWFLLLFLLLIGSLASVFPAFLCLFCFPLLFIASCDLSCFSYLSCFFCAHLAPGFSPTLLYFLAFCPLVAYCVPVLTAFAFYGRLLPSLLISCFSSLKFVLLYSCISCFLYFSYSSCLFSALLVVVVCFTFRGNPSASYEQNSCFLYSLLGYDALVSFFRPAAGVLLLLLCLPCVSVD